MIIPRNSSSRPALTQSASSWARPRRPRSRRSSKAASRGFVPRPRPGATADAVIVLWMAGGMAQTETFDPKTLHAVRAWRAGRAGPQHVPDHRHGRRSHQVHAGARADRQGHRSRRGDPHVQRRGPGFILHSRHQYHWHTGYIPPQPMAMPHLGAVVSRTLGPKNPTMPAFIAIGQNLEIGAESAADQGVSHGRFSRRRARPVPDRESARRGSQRPAGQGARRATVHHAAAIVREAASPASRRRSMRSDFQRESLLRSLESADRLLRSPSAKAFDLSLEPKPTFDAYNTGRFGQGCLLARRLIEGGRTLRRGHDGIYSVSLLGHA